jgi:hypothetical protein
MVPMRNTFAYAFLLFMIVVIAYIYKYPKYESHGSKVIGELPPLIDRVPKRLRHKLLEKKPNEKIINGPKDRKK